MTDWPIREGYHDEAGGTSWFPVAHHPTVRDALIEANGLGMLGGYPDEEMFLVRIRIVHGRPNPSDDAFGFGAGMIECADGICWPFWRVDWQTGWVR